MATKQTTTPSTKSVDLDKLKDQLATSEHEFEMAKAHVSRCDGAIQVLKHLIAQAEAVE